MTQPSLDFGRLYRVGDGVRALYRHADDATTALGIVTASGACGVDRGDLRRALDRGKGRYLAVEHAMSIAAAVYTLSPNLMVEIANAFISPLGLRVQVDEPLSDKERADKLEALVRSMPLGEQLLHQAYGGRR